ncbi:MAG: hypothetical protein LC124_04470 [Ignavibacteriales bacterium]|nr:hypothetical protein [Ignavibacterium sp.]MCZ2268090.1 hypothetical protein [Ignavibacteriales bacterium]
MPIKTVTTEIFQKEFGTRGSYPSLFDCSDNLRYIVKHSQLKRNYNHLINELIAVQLAKAISIPVPDFRLVQINQNILPNDYIFSAGKPSGLGFGSQFLVGNIITVPDIDTIIAISKSKKNEITEDLIKICAFDIWLRNSDRSPNNPNLLFQEKRGIIRLYAIDHSSIFSELNYLDLFREIDQIPTIGENLVDEELFSYIYFNYGLFFEKVKTDICKKIENVKEEEIQEILDNIPKEWNLKQQEIESIFNFINKRKTEVENHFNYLLKEIGL